MFIVAIILLIGGNHRTWGLKEGTFLQMLSRVFPVLEKIKVENQFNWGYGDNNGDNGEKQIRNADGIKLDQINS